MLVWNLESSYLSLPDSLYARIATDPAPEPAWAIFNVRLAEALGMGSLPEREDLLILTGSSPPPHSTVYAQAYAGHQYGHFAMLGDGRAAVLGEFVDPGGTRWDLQLKGSGPTPYSRGGDGKAVLGPMLREYLVGEYLNALGLPCTRALSVALTGETVWRDGAKPGAVLCRVAASHLRVGTFQYAAGFLGRDAVRAVADYAIARHYPRLSGVKNPYSAFLDAVGAVQAELVARWMCVGFVHGVMNTDNVSISGQAIDFGPCAFLDEYRSDQTFSSIDRYGRYAWGRQPTVAAWNHARLAESLLPVLGEDESEALALANESIARFEGIMDAALSAGFAKKLGIRSLSSEDRELVQDLFSWMEDTRSDFTGTFWGLTRRASGFENPYPSPPEAWTARWLRRLQNEEDPVSVMAAANPRIHPRNRALQNALDAAERGDMSPFLRLLASLEAPYAPESALPELEPNAIPDPAPFKTFCGT